MFYKVSECFLRRIRCGRSLEGYPFNPLLTQDDYLIIQERVIFIFSNN